MRYRSQREAAISFLLQQCEQAAEYVSPFTQALGESTSRRFCENFLCLRLSLICHLERLCCEERMKPFMSPFYESLLIFSCLLGNMHRERGRLSPAIMCGGQFNLGVGLLPQAVVRLQPCGTQHNLQEKMQGKAHLPCQGAALPSAMVLRCWLMGTPRGAASCCRPFSVIEPAAETARF